MGESLKHCWHPFNPTQFRVLYWGREVQDTERCCHCGSYRFTAAELTTVGPEGHGIYHPDASEVLSKHQTYHVGTITQDFTLEEPECFRG